MKKSLMFLPVLLVLGLVSCSTKAGPEEAVFGAIKGKAVYTDQAKATKAGDFSSDGKTLVISAGVTSALFTTMTYVEPIGVGRLKYKDSSQSYTLEQKDGRVTIFASSGGSPLYTLFY